jgi:hypothetical protein
VQVADNMQLILDDSPDIKGLFFFHFDAWIDPSGWTSQDYDNMWYPSVSSTGKPVVGYGPIFSCMTDTAVYKWWGWDDERRWHEKAVAAIADLNLQEFPGDYKKNEWCVGWSDIYYVPRRFFEDFISLSKTFAEHKVYHEVAIPTMLHIIDRSRQESPLTTVLDRFGDCWGSCCASDPAIRDVLWARCGHRLNYKNEEVTNAFYDALDGQARLLGNSTKT